MRRAKHSGKTVPLRLAIKHAYAGRVNRQVCQRSLRQCWKSTSLQSGTGERYATALAFADAFTWDVANVLENRVIRRVDLTTQNLDLQDVDLSGTGAVLPGETQTVLVSAFSGGYPGAGVATRIKAIYACPPD